MSTLSPNKGYSVPTIGGDVGAWGSELNTSLGVIDSNMGGNLAVAMTSANVTLTTAQAQNFSYTITGVLLANVQLIFPSAGGFYQISNGTTGAFTVTAITTSGTGIVCPQGQNTPIWSDATNMYYQIASSTLISQYSPGGMVNKFRNATMDVWQRGTALSITTASNYAADGWIVASAGANGTCGQITNQRSGANTLYALQLIGATSVTGINLTQRIESYIAAGLAGQTVTVQAQIYNNTIGGNITVALTTKYANSTDNWAASTLDVNSVALQVCALNTWTKVSYTFTASANATAGYEFIFAFGNNFTANTKSVVVAELDVRVTPGIATGLNANPPPPEMRPITTEMPACLRYFWAITSQVVGSANGATALASFPIYFPSPGGMRAAPTISGGSFAASTGSNGTFASQNTTALNTSLFNSANNWTNNAIISATAQFSAEL